MVMMTSSTLLRPNLSTSTNSILLIPPYDPSQYKRTGNCDLVLRRSRKRAYPPRRLPFLAANHAKCGFTDLTITTSLSAGTIRPLRAEYAKAKSAQSSVDDLVPFRQEVNWYQQRVRIEREVWQVTVTKHKLSRIGLTTKGTRPNNNR